MRQLSVAAVLLLTSTILFPAGQAFAQAGTVDSRDESAIHDYVLTMPRIQAYAAAAKSAQTEHKDDKSMTAGCEKLDDDKMALVDKIHYIEGSCPRLNTWIKQHGLTAKEFLLIPMSLITAGFAQVAVDAGGKPPAFINPANIQFLKEHQAELQKLDIMGEGKHEESKPDNSSDNDQ